MGILGGASSAVGGLAGLFGGHGKNPSDVANKRIGQIPGQVGQYYKPYQEAGSGALSDLQNRYKGLLDNPGDLYNKLGSGYTQSPGYANTLKEALTAGNNAYAAGGRAGSPGHAQASSEIAGNVANKDYETYLSHVLGMYGQGLQGEQGINQMGYGANTDYGNLIGNIGQQQAQYDYAGQAGKNSARAQDWSNIFGGLAGAGTAYGSNNWINDYLSHLGSQGA